MPIAPTYPGLYVQEIPSGVHPIRGVSTSDTAFIDRFVEGPVGIPTRVAGFDSFQRIFGPPRTPAGYGVMQYFTNGGQVAWIVRVAGAGALPATRVLTNGYPPVEALTLEAASAGEWGNQVEVAAERVDDDRFHLVARRRTQVRGKWMITVAEVYRNLGKDIAGPRFVKTVLERESSLIRLAGPGIGEVPATTGTGVMDGGTINDPESGAFSGLIGGTDGGNPDMIALTEGLRTLEHLEPNVINLLCVPAAVELDADPAASTQEFKSFEGEVAAFCEKYRCFHLMDIPSIVKTTEEMSTWMGAHDSLRNINGAVAFPRLEIADPDPLRRGELRNIGSSGTLAGIYARTDSARGIWKAPAGTATQLRSIVKPAGGKLNNDDSARLNPQGVNVIRTLPVYGTVSWGSRTLYGADQFTSEWAYVPVRRTALYIEESLVQGLKWVVFEPNDEPLWSQIRLNVGAFLHSMFRQSAFQGSSPRDAYLVKCDSETTTQADIDRGIVNILVGFAPLKPAEFVIIQLQQLTRPPEE